MWAPSHDLMGGMLRAAPRKPAETRVSQDIQVAREPEREPGVEPPPREESAPARKSRRMDCSHGDVAARRAAKATTKPPKRRTDPPGCDARGNARAD